MQTLIVSTASTLAERAELIVVGTDTDVLVMLVSRATPATDMYMLCCSNPVNVYNINGIQNAIG